MKNRIRGLVVSGSLGVGGAEIQLAKLLPRLNRNLFEMQVVYYSHPDGYPKKWLEEGGIPVTFLRGEHWNRWRYLATATDFMKKNRFDLVHAFLDSSNHYGRIPAILAGVPVIIGGLQGKKGLEGGWPTLYSLMNLRCAGWIVNSRMLKNWAEEKMFFMDRSPVSIVRNGLEFGDEAIRFKPNERTFYDELKSGRPVIGIVGRLHPVKNHLLFVETAHLLTQAGVEADYWIIGEGEMRPAIEERIRHHGLEERVKLLGLRQDVDIALSRMAVAVLTSDSESCPNALLEAMRASLPVVSTHCTTLDEIIQEGENGFVVPVGAAAALADKVAQILADPEKRRGMGLLSRKIVESRFSMAAAVKDLENAYIFFLQRQSRRYPELHEKLKFWGFSPVTDRSGPA
ncbi:MAG: glycosyltransferase [Deltaproteobacteria bacterium]|nr:glycosyltransferase [Deltaproteobacteria bacterium]